MSSGDQGIGTCSADVSSPTSYQDCAWLKRHRESLRDGVTLFACNDSLAPREEFAFSICHAAMCDVINQSRKECRDPWARGATESRH